MGYNYDPRLNDLYDPEPDTPETFYCLVCDEDMAVWDGLDVPPMTHCPVCGNEFEKPDAP